MTTKNYSCWQCDYFVALAPETRRDGYCRRRAPHALDFFGFEAVPSGDPTLTTKGDILTHNDTDTVRLEVGVDGQVLTADSASPEGVKWEDAFKSPLTAKGDVFTRDASGDARLAVGATGQVLSVDPSEPTGLKWVDASPLTTKGDIFVRDAAGDTRLAVGATGQVLSVDPSEPTGLKWIDQSTYTSPLTTKGDLLGHNGTGDTRLAVGADGQVLQADSSEPLGFRWAAPTGTSPLTTKGDIYTRNGAGDARLPVGADGQILVADSSEATGQKWQDNPAGNFIMQHQVARMGQMQNNIFDLARNGQTPSSGTNFPIANSYTTFDNSDIHPFAWPENAEIIALQISVTRAAVGAATLGPNPFLRLQLYENYGAGETSIGTVDIPIPAAYVDVNSNLGTNSYYSTLVKLPTPISGSGTGLYGYLLDIPWTGGDEQINAVKNIVVTSYLRAPLTDILDSGVAVAMAIMGGENLKMEVDGATVDLKAGALEGGTVALKSLETVEPPYPDAALAGTDAVSIEKFAYIVDGSMLWCGEYKPARGTVPPLP